MYTDDNKPQGRFSGQKDAPDSPEMQAFMEMFCRTMKKMADEEKRENEAGMLKADAANEPKTIDLVALFFRLIEKLQYIIIAAVLCAVLGGMYASNNITPVYTATAKLYILTPRDSVVNISDFQVGSLLTMDYQEVFRTWEVHEMVREALNVDYSYSAMQSMLTVTNPEDTRVLYITVRNPDPQMAADMANAYAQAAKQFIIKTMDTNEPNMFSVALTPGGSIAVSPSKYIIMGFMLGTVLACGVIVLLFVLDDRPRSPEDITKYAGVPTLAVIPETKKKVSVGSSRKTGGNTQ